MREIKFRAWGGDDKKYFVHFGLFGQEEGYFTQLVIDYGYVIAVQQFTGLKDKNGKEIYEGDILMYPDTESEHVDVGLPVEMKVAETPTNSFWPIEFRDGEFGMNVKGGEVIYGASEKHPEWISLKAFFADYCKPEECEVIGTIYENPDLLQ